MPISIVRSLLSALVIAILVQVLEGGKSMACFSTDIRGKKPQISSEQF